MHVRRIEEEEDEEEEEEEEEVFVFSPFFLPSLAVHSLPLIRWYLCPRRAQLQYGRVDLRTSTMSTTILYVPPTAHTMSAQESSPRIVLKTCIQSILPFTFAFFIIHTLLYVHCILYQYSTTSNANIPKERPDKIL